MDISINWMPAFQAAQVIVMHGQVRIYAAWYPTGKSTQIFS